MFTPLLLTASLTLGQPPSAVPQPVVSPTPVAVWPATQPLPGQLPVNTVLPSVGTPPPAQYYYTVPGTTQTVRLDTPANGQPATPPAGTPEPAADAPKADAPKAEEPKSDKGFFHRFYEAYKNAYEAPYKPVDPNAPVPPPPARRGFAAPFASPPLPNSEWQGYPLVGVPTSDYPSPLMDALRAGPHGEFFKESRIQIYGWATVSGNYTNNKGTNTPDSYWIVPNRFELDQIIVRVERQVDTVQQDHIDWGFKSTGLYGMDYRYMTAGGWGGNQLFKHNLLYGFDPTEQYFDLYLPNIAQGLIIRAGRWVACPDIETQFAPDNFTGSTRSCSRTIPIRRQV